MTDSLRIFGPAVVLAIAGFLVAYQFVDPAPPRRVVLATGSPGGVYHAHGDRYRAILARDGVTVELRESAGSVENLELLESGAAQVAFVQGGIARPRDEDPRVALASLYFEPLWVFHREGLDVTRLAELGGKRLAVGPEGSGTRALAIELLAANGIDQDRTTLLSTGGADAARALIAGDVDAVFLVSGVTSSTVGTLLGAEGVRLMSFGRAGAYARRMRHLSLVSLPQGAMDLARNVPQRDVRLVAATANLVARADFHPALVDLFMAAADEIHREGGLVEDYAQFPSPRYTTLPLSEEARRFFESGPSFLRRVLPFWAATLVERLLVMLVPLVALLIPLLRIMPPVYRWRIRSRIYRWYRELLSIDPTVHGDDAAERLRAGLAEIERIEHEVAQVEVPLSYADQLYALRLHIQLVREKLDEALVR